MVYAEIETGQTDDGLWAYQIHFDTINKDGFPCYSHSWDVCGGYGTVEEAWAAAEDELVGVYGGNWCHI